MRTAIALFIAAVAIASTGQLLMKRGALRSRSGSMIRSFLDPFTIAGYALMLSSTVVSTIALKTVPLKLVVSLQPLGFIVVVLLSVLLLREKMQRHHIWGMLIILAGIIVFNLGAL